MKIFYISKHTKTKRKTILNNIKATIKFVLIEIQWYAIWYIHRVKWIKNILINCYSTVINHSVKALDKYDQIIDALFIK